MLGAIIYIFSLFSGGGTSSLASKAKPFKTADYRRDGSRFASTGNTYVIEGRVEHIETRHDDRLIIISSSGNQDERLPLLLPSENKIDVNITRGDSFYFEVECKTGRSEDGSQVKGILIVTNAAID